ncbi:MAG: RNA methyltransferase [Bacteroidia bacterium]|nr:RNA methyltransferase [Bacteroidia bacterium]MCZ2249792.1 RNA methyltransferase [Bacteroidia bacterium]
MIQITSLSNPKIKALVKLEKASKRAETGMFIVEGKKEIMLCANAGFNISELYYCPDIVDDLSLLQHSTLSQVQLFEITPSIFKKVAYRESRDGYLAVVQTRYLNLKEIKLSNSPLIIVLEAVEKPGNLGAVLRSADAAGADAVIVCQKKTDIYNANTIRSSLGCIFTNQVVCCNNEECFEWLNQNNIYPYSAALTAHEFYHEQDFTQPTALIFGTEADGLSSFWLNNCKKQIKIPMRGKIDSLNVSNSCAIVLFEACRQRNFL